MYVKCRSNEYLVIHILHNGVKILRAAYFGAAYGKTDKANSNG